MENIIGIYPTRTGVEENSFDVQYLLMRGTYDNDKSPSYNLNSFDLVDKSTLNEHLFLKSPDTKVVAVLPGFLTFTRNFKMAKPEKDESLEKSILYKAKEQIPFPLDTLALGYSQRESNIPGDLDITIIGAKNEKLNNDFPLDYLDMVCSAHDALPRLYSKRFEARDNRKTIALLNVTGNYSDIVIINNNLISFARGIPYGTKDFSGEKKDKLVHEIKRTEDYHKSINNEKGIDELWLLNPEEKVKEVAEKTGVPVLVADPYKEFYSCPKKFDSNHTPLKDYVSEMMYAAAAVKSFPDGINLLKKEEVLQ